MQIPLTQILVRGADSEVLLETTVGPGEYVLGRAAEADICVEADLVSRQHARLTIDFDRIFIEDLQSANGTFVQGTLVSQVTRLWPHQKIQMGAVSVECRRVKTARPADESVPPETSALRELLPEPFLREKKYEIGGTVAQGGMGAILSAREATTERTVAMKVMLHGFSVDHLARFIAEAKVTARLEHPGIVPIYELGMDENEQVFYTMKFVRGITLHKVLKLMAEGKEATIRKYPLGALLTIFQKVCDALAFAHSKGVIHRDLKPQNIMLGDFGEVLVMDWGLAKVLAESPREEPRASAPPKTGLSASTTLDGTVMGTPINMSPEQARGEVDHLDFRSEVYSLGTILYQILTLRPPVADDEVWQVVEAVARGRVDPLTPPALRVSHLPKGRIPDSLAAIVRKAMAFEREQRYASVGELQRDIDAFQNGFATSAEAKSAWKQMALFVKRHHAPASGVLAVLLVGGVLGSQALLNGREAARNLASLRQTAPDFRQLAENQAQVQDFQTALQKLEMTIALDPGELSSYTRRVWLYVGAKQFPEAIGALKKALLKNPADVELARLTPLFERLAKKGVGDWSLADRRELAEQLQQRGLSGEMVALIKELQLSGEQKHALVRKRLSEWLGLSRSGDVVLTFDHEIRVTLPPVADLSPLKGLPIDRLNIDGSKATDLAPLRGMALSSLSMNGVAVADLGPLRGTPLRELSMNGAPVADLSPLKDAPLEEFSAAGCEIEDFSPLRGKPLRTLVLDRNPGTLSLEILAGAPLAKLSVVSVSLQNLEALSAMPLESANLSGTYVNDLSPLKGLHLKQLNLGFCGGLKDFSPLLELPELTHLVVHAGAVLPDALRRHPKLFMIADGNAANYREASDFWADYDRKRAGKEKRP